MTLACFSSDRFLLCSLFSQELREETQYKLQLFVFNLILLFYSVAFEDLLLLLFSVEFFVLFTFSVHVTVS